jgi:broad specificity polyphosphatase/5'/3'-nucleotidase SurE
VAAGVQILLSLDTVSAARPSAVVGAVAIGLIATYEDAKRAGDADSMTVAETLAMIAKTADKDRRDHPAE